MPFRKHFERFVLLGLVIVIAVGFFFGAHYYKVAEVNTDTLLPPVRYFLENRTGPIQSIGDEYILYTVRCGSSCEGLYMVHIATGEIYQGVLSYMTDDPERGDYTAFTDWKGDVHEFEGYMDLFEGVVNGPNLLLKFHTANTVSGRTYSYQVPLSLKIR